MLLLPLFLACGDVDKYDDDTSVLDTNTSGSLTDLTQGLTGNPDCWGSYTSDGNPYCVPGATGYFYGTFDLTGTSEGDQATGTEKWILFSNDTWGATTDGGDCEVVWTVVGNVTTPSACANCQIGLALTASINRNATTCPQGSGLVLKQCRKHTTSFGSNRNNLVFRSATQFAVGGQSGNAMNYLSEAACNFGVVRVAECTDMPQ